MSRAMQGAHRSRALLPPAIRRPMMGRGKMPPGGEWLDREGFQISGDGFDAGAGGLCGGANQRR